MAIHQVLPSSVDFSKYVGKWIVVCKDKVIAHNKNLNKVEKDIKECKTEPVIAKIPKKETLIF